MKWNNECDTCHNEQTCFDTPTDNCKQYKNYDVESIDRLIIRLGTLKEEIKQMSKHEDEIRADERKNAIDLIDRHLWNYSKEVWEDFKPILCKLKEQKE